MVWPQPMHALTSGLVWRLYQLMHIHLWDLPQHNRALKAQQPAQPKPERGLSIQFPHPGAEELPVPA